MVLHGLQQLLGYNDQRVNQASNPETQFNLSQECDAIPQTLKFETKRFKGDLARKTYD